MARLLSELIVSLVDRVTAPARRISQTIGELPQHLAAAQALNARRMDEMRGRMLDAAGGAYALAHAISAPIKAAMDMEAAMADVSKVVAFETPEGLKQFERDIIGMSQRMTMTAVDLTKIVAAAGQGGIAQDDLLRFTEQAAKVGTAFEISADVAGEAMAKLKTGLGLTVDGVFLLADSMNHLSNTQAASASDILAVVRGVGAQGKQFGFAATEVAAFGSAMVAAGAAPEVAATSFLSMGRALTKGASGTKRQSDALKLLGLEAGDVARRMQEDAAGTTVEVMQRLAALPKEMQAAVSSDLFGDEARALGPLLTNLDLVRESLGLVADETKYAGSAQAEAAARAGTSEGALKRLHNNITAVAIAVGEALLPPLNQAIEVMTPLIQRVADLAARFPRVTSAVLLGAAGLIGLRIAAIGASWATRSMAAGALLMGRGMLATLNPIKMVRLAIKGLKVALISTGIGAIVVALGAAAAFIVQNWDGVKETFFAFGRGFEKAFGPVRPLLDPVISGLSDLWAWIETVTGPMDASSWIAFAETLGRAVGGAVRYVVEVFQDFQKWIQGAIDKVVAIIPPFIKKQMGIEVTAQPLTPEEMQTAAGERAEAARNEADTAGWFASDAEAAASAAQGQAAYDAAFAAAMAEMKAENARLAATQQAPEYIFQESAPDPPPAPPPAAPSGIPPEVAALTSNAGAGADTADLAALEAELGAGALPAQMDTLAPDLNMSGQVTLDMTALDVLMTKIAQAKTALSGLDMAGRAAADRAATALDRSRATNLQGRPTS